MTQTSRWRSVPHVILIFLLSIGIYSPAFFHDFVSFDDPQYTYEEPFVEAGLSWEGLYWSFSDFHFSNYHPLTWLSYMLDVELFGMDPGAFHGVNIFLHFLCGVAFYALLRNCGLSSFRALIGALIFIAHPTQVESVAWISERKNLLSNLFGFLSLVCYLHFAQDRTLKTYFLSLFLFILALLSKSMVVTLPCILLLLDIWPLKRISVNSIMEFFASLKGVLLEKLPFFLLTALFCVFTFLAQVEAMSQRAISSSERFVQVIERYGHYMELFVFIRIHRRATLAFTHYFLLLRF
ncbi:MAG: hypothetical protein P1V97_06840 [Planctomycetota bacterium]|nr:hypothetical protein [Planctomycetota bacterium]